MSASCALGIKLSTCFTPLDNLMRPAPLSVLDVSVHLSKKG